MSEPVRFGLVGTGHWASAVHLPALQGIPGVQPVALHGRNPALAREQARRFGMRSLDDYDAFLDAVDAVSFAVPPAVQLPLAIRAAERGKGLLLEKPIAATLRGARDLLAAIEKARCPTAVFLSRQYSPVTLSLIAQARASGATRVEADYRSGAMVPGSPFASSTWREGPAGALLDMGPHLMGVAVSILGPVESVRASSADGIGCEVQARHRDGGRSTARIFLHDPTLDPDDERYTCAGPAGTVQAGPCRHDGIACYRATVQSLLHGHSTLPAPDARFACELAAILEAAAASLASGGRELAKP
ncbi:MAG: hypothetical protein RLZZ200_1073 [Pseudomonadota bacterium]|jgi:predicted dehydrogenase